MPDMASTSRMPIGGSATCSMNCGRAMVTMPPTGTTVKISSAGTSDEVGRQLEDEAVRLGPGSGPP